MPSRALKIDFDTDELKVVCVNSPLPSYFFVFLLNKKLKLRLCRSAKDMGDAEKNVSYAVYEYRCNILQNTWRVIENRCDSSKEQNQTSLFSRMDQRNLLFPKLKTTDFFICLNELSSSCFDEIKSVNQTVSCFMLPKNQSLIKHQLYT
tara:strand:+ start:697 stop:1143 length:447 start_codon:yes stop_codon:yes gene_type:complete